MQKTIKKFLNSSILISIAFIIVGILFLVFPSDALDVLRWIIAIFFISSGVGTLIPDLTSRKAPFFGGTALGAILLVVGILFAVNPEVMGIFPVILGTWFIASSVSTLRFSFQLVGKACIIAFVTSIISIVVGIILIINPIGSGIAMTSFAGAMMILHAVSSLVDLIIIKKNLKDITKSFNKLIEGEVVEEKKKKD